jgi:hypothetical protein
VFYFMLFSSTLTKKQEIEAFIIVTALKELPLTVRTFSQRFLRSPGSSRSTCSNASPVMSNVLVCMYDDCCMRCSALRSVELVLRRSTALFPITLNYLAVIVINAEY